MFGTFLFSLHLWCKEKDVSLKYCDSVLYIIFECVDDVFVLNYLWCEEKEASPILQNLRIIFVNKSDLEKKISLDKEYILGNTINEDGIEELKDIIIKKLNLENVLNKDMTYMSNIRQIDLLKRALKGIEGAISNLESGMPVDIVEIDITNVWNLLGEITGDTYHDELINTLFSNFCLGK